ncbi:mycothiol system anti-sigma-R factor [Leifsonia sp. Root112D2]|jgi:anti-sigma factor (TIGR02949 family)|uniref:mycothiol system anti-sigma-R factor n=1 Tax=Leifsonia sp. Root112D2 TaxID=1736426 RepID=UPI0007012EC4|nr:mycothiol system anti-sigma-R factor [Leifsonia sp. Root112D2]KQV05979.1 alpha-ketoglutarate decarboxylase [Leifsonia sp. Root112D2]
MTDCGCSKAKADLEEYLHNELRGADASDIREHLENCTSCTEEHHVGLVLTEAVKRACSETAPEELRAQVLARLRGFQATH